MIRALTCARLERLLNGALERAPATRRRLRELGELRIAIECSAPPWSCTAILGGPDVSLLPEAAAAADLRLRGSLPALLTWYCADAEDHCPGVTLTGDPARLAALRGIFRDLDWDWESALAARAGELPADLAGRLARTAAAAARDLLARAAALRARLGGSTRKPE